MPALNRFSAGLRLVRFAVFAMLAQIAVAIIVTFKLAGGTASALEWLRYLILANGIITFAMAIGTGGAIAELGRLHVRRRALVVSTIAFAIATFVIAWSYQTLSAFLDWLDSPGASLAGLESHLDDFAIFPKLAAVKSVAYGVGLIGVIGAVENAAHHNDQIGLREEAGHVQRALIVMLVGEVFYQLTFARANGVMSLFGLGAALLVSGFWIYCHFKVAGFLFNAAVLVAESSEMPVATVVAAPGEPHAPPAVAKPPSAAVKPQAAPVVVVDRPSAPAATPIVKPPGGEVEGPKLLR